MPYLWNLKNFLHFDVSLQDNLTNLLAIRMIQTIQIKMKITT